MTETHLSTDLNKIQMLGHLIETDTKLLTTWIGSIGMLLLNKFGINLIEYELWKIVALDILTGLSLLVAIGYTIFRWRRLIKLGREKDKK